MKKILLLSVLFAVVFSFSLSAEENYLHISIDATIMAQDPNQAAKMLTDWAEEQSGGYFTIMSSDYVVLRFPYGDAGNFRTFLDSVTDDVLSYNSSATDLRQDILAYRSGIKAREEILAKNKRLVSGADFDGTLYLEQEILRLTSEMETMKGQLRKAENDRRKAYAVISINFKSQTLPENPPSSFNWINGVDFYHFVNGSFGGSGKGSHFDLNVPEGFAFVDNKAVFRAVSPEGVRFQVRSVKNYPRKELKFWAQALENQLTKGGYKNLGRSRDFTTGLGEGYAMEWGLPLGNSDYIYMTAIIPDGKKLLLVEAAGDLSIYSDYRDSIMEAVESLK